VLRNISAQHGSVWNCLIVNLIVKRLSKIKKV
jgi:hypothetical protein